MKILAIEKEIGNVTLEHLDALLREEAQHVYQLYLSDSLREIYFTENKNAILVLEADNKEVANTLLSSLPLVAAGKISFELMELRPYTGYQRIIP